MVHLQFVSDKQLHIALVGNPNSGKSSLFNELTGLNQQVGNFPGVTVDKKTGSCSISADLKATIIDLPGTYSLYPRREDEWVAYRVLMNQDPEMKMDMIVLVADASNLKRNLLFVSQIIDLKIPVILALSMLDISRKMGITIDEASLAREIGVPVIPINPRKGKGIAQLKKAIEHTAADLYKTPVRDFVQINDSNISAVKEVKNIFPEISDYKAIHYLINHESFHFSSSLQNQIEKIEIDHQFNHTKVQAEEILLRYQRINNIMKQSVSEPSPMHKKMLSDKLDNVLLHKRWGYLILLGVLFLLFQSVFWLAELPMNLIESGFAFVSAWFSSWMPDVWYTNLFINGILAGVGGILVFVPQIMILFGLITILEDTGYMARISFLSDKLMRKVGLNGKSVMPMISGFACAVPAIMSARNIENKKERLLTILITPLMSCSARLPVYTILISLVIPQNLFFGFLSQRGLVMMALYLMGPILALIVSYIAKWFINIQEKSFFILELPTYRSPRWNNVLMTMLHKAKIFVFDAGKIIMIISLVLWGLSTYGPSEKMKAVADKYNSRIVQNPLQKDQLTRDKNAALLEQSFAGILGRSIEPIIKPLGYDWKIGIALVTSFAAREVFVGTMATLYSVEGGAEAEESTLTEKMKSAKRNNGEQLYTLSTGISLLIFYALAMQCMSTIAIVKRETKSWKWPLIQLGYMTGLAYVLSWLGFIVFS